MIRARVGRAAGSRRSAASARATRAARPPCSTCPLRLVISAPEPNEGRGQCKGHAYPPSGPTGAVSEAGS